MCYSADQLSLQGTEVVLFTLLQTPSLSQHVLLLLLLLLGFGAFLGPWPCVGCSGSPAGLSVPRLLGIGRVWSEALETVEQRHHSCQGGNAECQAGWLPCFLGHRNSWSISVTQDCWLHVQELFWLPFSLFYNVTQVALYPLLCRAGKETREISCS